MSNSFSLYFKGLIIIIIFLILFICIFFIPANPNWSYSSVSNENLILDISSSGYVWPAPGYTRINSYFGYRTSPTAGASSYHSGLVIGAPEGSKLVAVTSGKITFAQFLGGGGYTITLSFDNFKVSYCHVDPNFIVSVGDSIKQGQIIALVGPKNVYGVSGNLYKDSNGNPTNGATTGCHLHLGFRVNEQYVNPLNFF